MVARTYTSLPPIVNIWFQFLFHSPPWVLFTFPSRYLYTIGHQGVFSLTQWSGQIPTKLHVLRGTREYTLLFASYFYVRGCHALWLSFPEHSINKKSTTQNLYELNVYTSQPLHHNVYRLSRDTILGFSPFAHHYLGNHFVFFS